jgi:hypothetical protein
MEPYSDKLATYGEADAASCESCGRRPARRVTVRRHVGLFFLQRFVTVNAVACRTCGRRLVRDFTLRTLAQGWWGAISFFFNLFVLGANAYAWLRLGRLNEPSVSGTDGLMEPSAPANWSGADASESVAPKKRSRLLRGGAVGGVLVAMLVVVGMASWGWDATHDDHSGPHGAPITAREAEREMTGQTFVTDGGERMRVDAADCNGANDVADVHFRCLLTFSSSEQDDVLVHVLPNELFFKSSAASGA